MLLRYFSNTAFCQ